MSGYDTSIEFMKHYEPWWDTGCDCCSVSAGECECKQLWEEKHGEGSKPNAWGWLIIPIYRDTKCHYCSYQPSTYDGCCERGMAYHKYRYSVVFFPEWVPDLMKEVERVNTSSQEIA